MRNKMTLNVEGKDYTLYWEEWGFSYAKCFIVEKRIKKFLWLIPYTKTVRVWYNSDPMPFVDANLATKEFIIEWYTNTIKEYIKYKKSWGYE